MTTNYEHPLGSAPTSLFILLEMSLITKVSCHVRSSYLRLTNKLTQKTKSFFVCGIYHSFIRIICIDFTLNVWCGNEVLLQWIKYTDIAFKYILTTGNFLLWRLTLF